MAQRRGYIKEINGTHFWYDINDNHHMIQEMEDSYVENCIKLLETRLSKTSKSHESDKYSIAIFKAEQLRRNAVAKTLLGRLLYG